jgi:hypothetical protein
MFDRHLSRTGTTAGETVDSLIMMKIESINRLAVCCPKIFTRPASEVNTYDDSGKERR